MEPFLHPLDPSQVSIWHGAKRKWNLAVDWINRLSVTSRRTNRQLSGESDYQSKKKEKRVVPALFVLLLGFIFCGVLNCSIFANLFSSGAAHSHFLFLISLRGAAVGGRGFLVPSALHGSAFLLFSFPLKLDMLSPKDKYDICLKFTKNYQVITR